MADPTRRHGYAEYRILIESARILHPPFSGINVSLTGAHVELLRNLVDYANRESSFVDAYHDGYYIGPDADAWDSIRAVVAELEDILMADPPGYYNAYVCVRDKKALGVHGGTFTTGAWRTRDINDELADVAGIASISGNQITLAQGTYRCLIVAPARVVDKAQARLYNVSDTAEVLLSASGFFAASGNDSNKSVIVGRFTLSAAKVLEVQHRCGVTKTSSGFGYACGYSDEIYTTAEFWREV